MFDFYIVVNIRIPYQVGIECRTNIDSRSPRGSDGMEFAFCLLGAIIVYSPFSSVFTYQLAFVFDLQDSPSALHFNVILKIFINFLEPIIE